MACTLSNKCAKNLYKQTVLLQLIIKNVVTCFFGTQCTIMAGHNKTEHDCYVCFDGDINSTQVDLGPPPCQLCK